MFCASMADVFEDREEPNASKRAALKPIEATPQLDWLLLTKRPQNVGGWRVGDRIGLNMFGSVQPSSCRQGRTNCCPIWL